MKKYLILFVLVLTGQFLIAQIQKQKDFNGWEFLEWQTNKNTAEKLLSTKGIEIQNTYSDAAYDKIIRFQYEDMQTWLYFDSLYKLSYIDQLKDFSVVNLKDADTFYKKTKIALIQKYGEPYSETNDTTNNIVHLSWLLSYCEIAFTYDYKYKIIDEFGCCSYKVDIHITPVERVDTSKVKVKVKD